MNRINDCFDRGLLRRVEPSAEKSQRSLTQAKEWLSEAEKNLSAEAYRSAISSIYMAIFHSARAVLFRDGIREKSHYCVGAYLEKYVEEGHLEERWIDAFDSMRSDRHTGQYSFQAIPTRAEIESGLDLASSFIERMSRLLKETP